MVGNVGVGNDLAELVIDVEGPLWGELLLLDDLLEGLVWLRLDALLGGLVKGVGYGKWDHVVLHIFHLLIFCVCSGLLRLFNPTAY